MAQAQKQLVNLPPKKEFSKSPAFLKRLPNLPTIGEIPKWLLKKKYIYF